MRNALRQLSFGTGGKSGGRNSQGRITAYHRGGGAKRLHRHIDLKRSTSSMGIVERIEYDPNRSSRIALVRWMEGVRHRQRRNPNTNTGEEQNPKSSPPTTATVRTIFSCSSLLPPMTNQRKVPNLSSPIPDSVLIGLPSILPQTTQLQSKPTSAHDVFISALSKGESAPIPFPRVAVAGAKPTFFVPQLSEQTRAEKENENNTVSVALSEVRKWVPKSIVWANRIKPKAALSWQSLVQQEKLGLSGVAEHNLSKLKIDNGCGGSPGKAKGDRAEGGVTGVDCIPVSYIKACHQLEVGKMVMNCDASKAVEGGAGVSWKRHSGDNYEIFDINAQIGTCVPLSDIRIGSYVHDIETKPGQGAKLVRSAGTTAKVIKEPGRLCHLRLPSGVVKVVDSRCRATIGTVSNINHGARKLRKAGHSRWLGITPTVRGVAMNPVDHPHGGGEGRTSGGRPSVSPWGKPTKAGYKTAGRRRRHSI